MVRLLLTLRQHWVNTVRRLFDAFVYSNSGKDPLTYYLTLEAGPHVAATAFVKASVAVRVADNAESGFANSETRCWTID